MLLQEANMHTSYFTILAQKRYLNVLEDSARPLRVPSMTVKQDRRIKLHSEKLSPGLYSQQRVIQQLS